MRPFGILNLALGMIIACSGCATFKTIPSKMKAFVMREPASEDPLVADTSVSKEFKTAKKELKNADATVREFAYMCESRGDFAKAKECYQDLLADNPENVHARLGIARVEFKTGRKAEAEEILRAAAQKHPNSAQVWMEMGRVQTARDQWGAAAVSLDKAAKLEPNNQQVRYELGLALARSNRLEEAVPHLKQAVGESAAFYNVAFVLKEAGRTGEARFWTERALNSYPDERTRNMAQRMLASLSTSGQQRQLPSRQTDSQVAKARVIPGKTTVEAYKETPRDWRNETPAPNNANAAVVATANTSTGVDSTTNSRSRDNRSYTNATMPIIAAKSVGGDHGGNGIHQTSFTPGPANPQKFTNAAPRIIQQPVETTSVHRGRPHGAVGWSANGARRRSASNMERPDSHAFQPTGHRQPGNSHAPGMGRTLTVAQR